LQKVKIAWQILAMKKWIVGRQLSRLEAVLCDVSIHQPQFPKMRRDSPLHVDLVLYVAATIW
jgi:hypothetical protein